MGKTNNIVYHLSHNDLDGYGSQYVTLVAGLNTINYNCNYGEIQENIEIIKKSITSDDQLLITDVNLTEAEASYIDKLQKEVGFDLKLLDHHKTGRDVAKKYDWYHLDETKCGTFLTWEFFDSLEETKLFASIVNDYDLWKEENEHFNKGKALTKIVEEYKYSFSKGLEEEENKMILTLLDNAYRLMKKNISVSRVEEKMYSITRILFLDGNKDNEDLTLHEIKVNFYTDKIMELEPKAYTVVNLDGYNTYLFTGLSKIFQIFSNKILNNIDDLDVAINISKSGTMSIRSRREDIDLGIIARKYFNGGGHPQASGGKLDFEEETLKDEELVQLFIKTVKNKGNIYE